MATIHLNLPPATLAELDRRAGVELRSRANLATLLLITSLDPSSDTTEGDHPE